MRAVATHVGVRICHDRELCKNGCTHRDAVNWEADLHAMGPMESRIRRRCVWRHLANTIKRYALGGDGAVATITVATSDFF